MRANYEVIADTCCSICIKKCKQVLVGTGFVLRAKLSTRMPPLLSVRECLTTLRAMTNQDQSVQKWCINGDQKCARVSISDCKVPAMEKLRFTQHVSIRLSQIDPKLSSVVSLAGPRCDTDNISCC